jgi:hypothetical protein
MPLFIGAGERWALGLAHAWGALIERGLANQQQAQRHATAALRITLEIRAWYPTLDALQAVTVLLADDGELGRAAELYALSERENAALINFVARRELAEIAAALPADAAAAAQVRGWARDLWVTAEELLAELINAGWDTGGTEA